MLKEVEVPALESEFYSGALSNVVCCFSEL